MRALLFWPTLTAAVTCTDASPASARDTVPASRPSDVATATSPWFSQASCPMPSPGPITASDLRCTAAFAPVDLAPFAALPADPSPPALIQDTHYWTGNEHRFDVFHDSVVGRGGVHVGVGAEQNWILAGWSRADLVVLVDFDQTVVDLHYVHIAALRTATTRDELRALWTERGGKRLVEAVRAHIPDRAQRRASLAALGQARGEVALQWRRYDERFAARGVPWLLSDDAQFAHCRALALAGRVFAVRGDLTRAGTLRAIAAAVRHAGLVVRTFYPSNAEEYFRYDPVVRANIAALPFDADSRVLRTVSAHERLPHDDGEWFHYNVQTGPSYAALTADPSVVAVAQLVRWAPPGPQVGLSILTATSVADARAAAPPAYRPPPPEQDLKKARKTTSRAGSVPASAPTPATAVAPPLPP